MDLDDCYLTLKYFLKENRISDSFLDENFELPIYFEDVSTAQSKDI